MTELVLCERRDQSCNIAATKNNNHNQRHRTKRCHHRRNGSINVDSTRHGFHTKVAVAMTFMFLLSIGIISLLSSSSNDNDDNIIIDNEVIGYHHIKKINYYNYNNQNRLLEDNAEGDDNNGNDNNDNDDQPAYNDFSSYSCNSLYQVTTEDNMEQRCAFARTCNGGTGIFAPIVYCRTNTLSTLSWCLIMSPFLTVWLVILFRMLGSTAEDYFSPSLEMFSVKLGLPPRFAGVSLLALGNGAADVSATVNAIVSDPKNGYHISLGALTGAAMFVGCVVAGVVIVTAKGVRCRGALVRDVLSLLITVIVVSCFLYSGKIGPTAISTFISMYILFVVIVLIADIYHRAVVIPRIQAQKDALERQRQINEARAATASAADALNNLASSTTEQQQQQQQQQQPIEMGVTTPQLQQQQQHQPVLLQPNERPRLGFGARALNTVMGALSNYDYRSSLNMVVAEGDGTVATNGNVPSLSQQHEAERPDGWGIESDDILHDRHVRLHGENGLLDRHRHHHHGQHHSPLRTQDSEEAEGVESNINGPSTPYLPMSDEIGAVQDGIEGGGVCLAPESRSFAAYNWIGAWEDGKQELFVHMEDVWADIVDNEDNNILDKFLLICELPFTLMRKLTVPLPCEGYYCRALVALSMVVAPLWIGGYLSMQHEINIFWPYIVIFFALSIPIGAMILRFAPAGDGDMALLVSTPIALYGFVIAATWIDLIADQLVSLLDFLGIIFRIPGSIMGLTILAWGNSMADLSANITMARKGLANMAMTACFAGPVFNILIGLGLGFSTLSSMTGNAEIEVNPSPSITVGMVFITLNVLLILFTGLYLTAGTISKECGYATLGLYVIYVVTSVALSLKG